MNDRLAQGALLVLLGVWLLLQTLVGGLPQRVLSWRNWNPKASTTPATPTAKTPSMVPGGFV